MVYQNAKALGLSQDGIRRVRERLEKEVAEDRLMGAALQISRGKKSLKPICVGRRRLPPNGPPVAANTIFLIASITKPIVASAFMRLVELGKVALTDPVARHVPEFGANGKQDVQVLHLLTHTSGLPDQIDRNREYREARRPLGDFVRRICELPLLFEPGTKLSYQSAGIAMLGEILERIEGVPLRDYLRTTIFKPLGLKDTSLGITRRSSRESDIKMGGEGLIYGGDGTDFDWNSDYWRGLGAPWGGLLTTVEDLSRLMRVFLAGGTLDGVRILTEASVNLMTTPLVLHTPDPSERGKPSARYGLGWRLQTRGASTYGDLVSDRTFGHAGATGTLAWIDPETGVTCVFLTNDPAAAPELAPVISNMVAAALLRK